VEWGKAPPAVVAKAYCLWGDYVAAAAEHDYQQAIQHHMQAIKLAEPLADDPKTAVRRAAKELLVDANLAVAHDVGWGRWQHKSKVVPKWISRASGFADDLLAREQGSLEVQLRVHEGALAALAGVADPQDVQKSVEAVSELGKKLLEGAKDPAYKARLSWQLAIALNDAVEIEASLKHWDQALALGNSAVGYFDDGEAAGKQLPAHDFLRGKLCYRLGAVLAIERHDHKQAVTWFDRAVPMLESPVPAAVIDAGKQGEIFVSMAVSYWDLKNRDEALRLTNQGVKLMEQAASDGLLAKTALAIPYGNLASMYEQLGDAQTAKKYAELAARHEETKAK
jgi:tetratricopeptide (TPR) repeat protein